MDFEWDNEKYMLERLASVVETAEAVAKKDLKRQRPFLIHAIWRTEGDSSVLDEEAFDVSFWSDLAFMQFFTKAARRGIAGGNKKIERSARAVIWLVKSLWDYSAQGKVTFGRTHSLVTFSDQSDKAGAFSDNASLEMVKCQDFLHPRIKRNEVCNILTAEGSVFLSPERRLDGVLTTNYDFLRTLGE